MVRKPGGKYSKRRELKTYECNWDSHAKYNSSTVRERDLDVKFISVPNSAKPKDIKTVPISIEIGF
jgi:hypothetical protein